jgi:hypothetical protein
LGCHVAIYRILQNSAFEPEDVKRMTDSYEAVLRELNLVDRRDPLTEIIAPHIIELAQTRRKIPTKSAGSCSRVLKAKISASDLGANLRQGWRTKRNAHKLPGSRARPLKHLLDSYRAALLTGYCWRAAGTSVRTSPWPVWMFFAGPLGAAARGAW